MACYTGMIYWLIGFDIKGEYVSGEKYKFYIFVYKKKLAD